MHVGDADLVPAEEVLREREPTGNTCSPGTATPGFRARALRVAAPGVFPPGVPHKHVALPRPRALGVMTTSGPGPRRRTGTHGNGPAGT